MAASAKPSSPYTSAWPSCLVAIGSARCRSRGPCWQSAARMKSRSSIGDWRGSSSIAADHSPTWRALHLISLAGESALLATPARNGLIVPTKLLQRVSEAACDLKPKLLLLDNSADVYGGNENDRGQVRQFIGLLRSIAMASGAGVLLTSHPSLTGLSSGSGLSGSTAWNASVRSRLYFKRATIGKDDKAVAGWGGGRHAVACERY